MLEEFSYFSQTCLVLSCQWHSSSEHCFDGQTWFGEAGFTPVDFSSSKQAAQFAQGAAQQCSNLTLWKLPVLTISSLLLFFSTFNSRGQLIMHQHLMGLSWIHDIDKLQTWGKTSAHKHKVYSVGTSSHIYSDTPVFLLISNKWVLSSLHLCLSFSFFFSLLSSLLLSFLNHFRWCATRGPDCKQISFRRLAAPLVTDEAPQLFPGRHRFLWWSPQHITANRPIRTFVAYMTILTID